MTGNCGGSKKPQVTRNNQPSKAAPKAAVRKTNWATGFGTPKVKFSFSGGGRGK